MANKKFNSWIKNICMGWGFIMAGSLLASCNDLMHDDLPPCDMGVDLHSSTTTTCSVPTCSKIMWADSAYSYTTSRATSLLAMMPITMRHHSRSRTLTMPCESIWNRANTDSQPSPSKRNMKMHSRSQVPNSR